MTPDLSFTLEELKMLLLMINAVSVQGSGIEKVFALKQKVANTIAEIEMSRGATAQKSEVKE